MKNVIPVVEVAEGTPVKCSGCGKEIIVANDVAKELTDTDSLAYCQECMAKQNNTTSEGSTEAANTIETALGK